MIHFLSNRIKAVLQDNSYDTFFPNAGVVFGRKGLTRWMLEYIETLSS